MKWMGGISYQALLGLPDYHFRAILEMMREEAERIEAAKNA
jgi:hypothetical protein